MRDVPLTELSTCTPGVTSSSSPPIRGLIHQYSLICHSVKQSNAVIDCVLRVEDLVLMYGYDGGEIEKKERQTEKKKDRKKKERKKDRKKENGKERKKERKKESKKERKERKR